VLTVTGKGFKDGTTVTVWRDANANGVREIGEVDLATALVGSDDRFGAAITITNPPFQPGTTGNRINAIVGLANSITIPADIPTFELKGKVTVSPTTVQLGNTISIDLKDFPASSAVSGVTLAGVPVTVPAGTTTSVAGEATFSATVPQGVPTGIQALNVNFAGSGNRSVLLTILAPACILPTSGDWLVAQNCTFTGSATAPANVIVEEGVALTIAENSALNIDFSNHHLRIKNGANVLIKSDGKIH
jgi:hypothetical protein